MSQEPPRLATVRVKLEQLHKEHLQMEQDYEEQKGLVEELKQVKKELVRQRSCF
eukprot:SAG22_NODE_263_length_13359_cov_3.396531_7_plen_54_part_00